MEVRQIKINTPQGERLFIITQAEYSEGGIKSESIIKALPLFRVHMIGLSFGEFFNNSNVIDCDSLEECEKAIEAITYAINMEH